MINKQIRDLAIALLDDQDGINEAAYIQLSALLAETGNQDITQSVDATSGRYYLGEAVADELRNVVTPN